MNHIPNITIEVGKLYRDNNGYKWECVSLWDETARNYLFKSVENGVFCVPNGVYLPNNVIFAFDKFYQYYGMEEYVYIVGYSHTLKEKLNQL
jgi:hypothetical protein